MDSGATCHIISERLHYKEVGIPVLKGAGDNVLPSRGMVDLECFFLLHAAKVRSSCEEGPLQSAYHNPKLDVTKMKQNTTSSCSGQKLQSNKLTNQIKPTPE